MTNYQNPQTAAIMSVGMKALHKALPPVDMEIFLVAIKQEQFDYTEWRRDHLWKDMTAEEIMAQAARNHPEKSYGLEDTHD